ncbi:MAG: TonB family protein [Candidatus Zixiibacteriota bacterium]
MTELIHSIGGIITEPHLAASLISIIIKSSLIMVVAGLTMVVLRRRSSVVRSFILSLAFVVTLILPALTFITPSWQISLPAFFSLPMDVSASTVSDSGFQSIEPASEHSLSLSAFTMFITVWITGTLILLFRLLLGWYLMLRISKRSKKTDKLNIIELTDSILAKLKPRRPVALTFSADISSPVTIGYWNHTIIFPKHAQEWPMRNMEMSLTHELAHIKRYDTLWYLIGSVTAVLYWFNPLVWICRRMLVTEAEIVCDDFVLKNGSCAPAYAENLLGIARHINRKQFVIPVGVGMARRSELEGRLVSIMSDRKRIVSVKNSIFTLGILSALAFVLPLSGVQLLAVETDNQATLTGAHSAGEQSSDDTTKNEKQKVNEENPDPNDFVAVATMPEMTVSKQPEYPADAKKQNIEGDVWIKALVDKEGSVVKAMIGKSSGSKQLDKSALDAAYGCKFRPAMQEDKPVAVWITYKVSFVLDEKKEIVK